MQRGYADQQVFEGNGLWNKRGGHWMEVASYQTQIQAAPAKP